MTVKKTDKRKIKLFGYTRPSKTQSAMIYNPDGLARRLCSVDSHDPLKIVEFTEKGEKNLSKLKVRETTKKGYREANVGDGIATDRINCKVRRGVAHKDSIGTLNTQKGSWGTVTEDYRIRRLTPKECERLQGFPDDWTKFGKEGEEISDTQRYKCVGNAVTTTVITAIINEMFKDLYE